MLTPLKYWRVPCGLDTEDSQPATEFILPEAIASQSSPPRAGHGIAIAAYDEVAQTGLSRWLGIVTGGAGTIRTVEWKPSNAQIWVDTGFGRSKWKGGAFGFASSKIAGYGLHELWSEAFGGMDLRDHTPAATRPTGPRKATGRSGIPPERLTPIEVIGEPTAGQKAGVIYVLKSAYGYKVGRTRNVPARMRAFGVHLPIVYTIPLCAWFEDCHEAERRYHNMFASKRINGEWFDLTDRDVEKIRMRT
ncbi:TPA: GIY-YIG nuclease family protein [Burkholderia multivorans]|nr:GIY-YIG nuclease family protein [Burkholderia multivorans]MDN7883071.1 GIY-YIG nuclease family protein [Burkholderia multivorans]MDN7972740.1 GIY-YIG nuclease family protein [Burkholderia multivorans]MDN7978927.1 GIY-YIG nuclease family protein [Burkholderia multivorans]MDN7984415.1 GIY-YIG nuclease family protein [Burkholderia multivorans]